MFKQLFVHNQVDDSIFRSLGAGVTLLLPLLLGLFLNNMELAQFATLGTFSYLAFQRKSVCYNLYAVSLHGVALIASFALGMLVGKAIWLLPFVIALLSMVGFLTSKVFRIPKPAHFFILMLFATGTNTNLLTGKIPLVSLYVAIGVCSGILVALLVSLIERLPFRTEKTIFEQLSITDKYYALLYERPKVWIDAIHFAFILFVAGYISFLLRHDFGYWLLISSAAVLSGEEISIIQHRYMSRIVGSVVGLLIGLVLMMFNIQTVPLLILLMLLNSCIEYFVPRNYAVANFFINPMVMLLSLLTSNPDPTVLILARLNGVVLGSVIAILLIRVMHYALRINNMEY